MRILPILLLALPSITWGAEVPGRVLFIGNSYTAQIKGTLVRMVEASPSLDVELGFITPGGRALSEHLENSNTVARIRDGSWDRVVLQEQSLTSALSKEHAASFQQSVEQFSGIIRAAGAEPVLYMTWGRRDGYKKNLDAFPDYRTMQDKVSAAYLAAGERNRIEVAPVGMAWALVRSRDPELGQALYRKDGSHPAQPGAVIAAGVLFQTLFGKAPPVEQLDGVEPRHARLLAEAIETVCAGAQAGSDKR